MVAKKVVAKKAEEKTPEIQCFTRLGTFDGGGSTNAMETPTGCVVVVMTDDGVPTMSFVPGVKLVNGALKAR